MEHHVEPVNVAIVGCGAITKSQHLPAVLRSPNANLFALVDSQRENAENLARKFALKCLICEDLSEIIDKVDGVIIATPNHTHYPIATISLKKGVPVFIEKPITTTYEDAVKLCQLADEKNAFISVGYKTRYFPSVILLKELMERNFFGKINHFYYEFGSKGGWAPVSGYNIDRKKAGGGVLVVSGTHFLDRMLYWFGEPQKIEFRDDSYGGVEANCKADMVFNKNGQTFTGSFFISKTLNLKNMMILDTEKYTCELGEKQVESITIYPKDNPEMKMEVYPQSNSTAIAGKNIFQKQFEEFISNIRHRGSITVDGWFAARSMKLIEQAYENRSNLEEPWIIYKK